MSVKVGSLLGIPVKLNFTLVLAVVLVAWSLASGYMPAEYPGLSSRDYWITGSLGAVTLFASVLVHEMAHSFVAKRSGLPVGQITLFLFGGVSEIEKEPKSPGEEFRVAVVGPVSSFVIGAALGALWLILDRVRLTPLFLAPLEYGSYINFMLGGFNLLPAFPLDGGRILRSALWKRKNDLILATRIASKFGVGFSYLFMLWGVLAIFGGLMTNGLWYLLMGWFLKSGAEGNLTQTVVSEALASIAIKDIMTKEVDTVEPDLTLSDLIEKHFSKYKHGGFPVVKGSTLLGLVTLEDVRKVPKEKWTKTRVSDVMTTCERLGCLQENEKAVDAFMKMSRLDVGRLPVRQNGNLVGIVTRSDILRVIRIRSELTLGK